MFLPFSFLWVLNNTLQNTKAIRRLIQVQRAGAHLARRYEYHRVRLWPAWCPCCPQACRSHGYRAGSQVGRVHAQRVPPVYGLEEV